MRDLIATTDSSKLLALSSFVQGLSAYLLDHGGFYPAGQHEVNLRLTLRTLELAKALSLFNVDSLLLLDPLPLPRAFNDETDSELRGGHLRFLRTLSIEARNDLADPSLHLGDRSRCGACRHTLEKMISEGKTLLTKLTSSEPGVRQGWAFAPDERNQLDQMRTVHKDWTEWISQRHGLTIRLSEDQSLTPPSGVSGSNVARNLPSTNVIVCSVIWCRHPQTCSARL